MERIAGPPGRKGDRLKTRRFLPNNKSSDSGPLKASYNPSKNSWEMKYEFKSRKSVAGQRQNRESLRNPDTSSDYGTMSTNKLEDDIMDDLIPGLNLGPSGQESHFNDITVEERRERIDSIISEIMSVPRLSEANITQRSVSNQEKMRKYLSNENLNERRSNYGSRNSGTYSKQSIISGNSRAPSIQRSVSTPKLSLPVESRSLQPGRNNNRLAPDIRNKPSTQGRIKQTIVPRLELNTSNQVKRQTSKSRSVSDDLSSEFLPVKDTVMKNYVPSLGDDTQNELAIGQLPSFGDDTEHTLNTTSASLEAADFAGTSFQPDVNDAEEDRPRVRDFLNENRKISAAVGVGSRAASRQQESALLHPKHKPGGVPKYLKARQAEWRDAAQAALDAIPDPDCPPGHVRLPEPERLVQLMEMERTHAALLQDWNRLPVSSDTRRVVEKRAQIENLLKDLDEGIRVYSRPKVFIKKDE